MRLLHFLILLFPLVSFANETSFYISKDFAECDGKYYENSLVTEYADFKYDKDKNELHINASFSNEGGQIANGFHFGINSEPTLQRNDYKLPYFYVDASKVNLINDVATGTPKISVFTFNRMYQDLNNTSPYIPNNYNLLSQSELMQCNNKYPSYNTQANFNINGNIIDFNKTEFIPPTTIPVLLASVEQFKNNGILYRNFTIILDLKALNNTFSPNSLYQKIYFGGSNYASANPQANNKWKGFDFDSNNGNITLDFVPVNITSSTYSGNQLTDLQTSSCSICRLQQEKTNTTPKCIVKESVSEMFVNEEKTFTFELSDPDSDSFYVEFAGISNFTSVPVQNQLFTSRTATLTWTPKKEDANKKFEITARFIQNYGKINAVSNTCSVTVSVSEEKGLPVCTEVDISKNKNSILNSTKKLKKLLTRINNKNKKLQKSLRVKKDKRTDHIDNINLFTELSLGYISDLPETFKICTKNFFNCTASDFFDNYREFEIRIKGLYCDGRTKGGCPSLSFSGLGLLKELRKNTTRVLISQGKSSFEAKTEARNEFTKYRNRSKRLAKNSLDKISTIEVSQTNRNQHFSCPAL